MDTVRQGKSTPGSDGKHKETEKVFLTKMWGHIRVEQGQLWEELRQISCQQMLSMDQVDGHKDWKDVMDLVLSWLTSAPGYWL